MATGNIEGYVSSTLLSKANSLGHDDWEILVLMEGQGNGLLSLVSAQVHRAGEAKELRLICE